MVEAQLTWDKHNQNLVACHACPRLVEWRELMSRQKRRAYIDQEYWGKPVPGFGDISGRLLVVGLAPGAHGSNRTGRMFTGDASGEFLFAALNRAGFANQTYAADRNDGLKLKDMFISAVCRCAPPQNKPNQQEIDNCRPYLLTEIDMLKNLTGIVALGKLAFDELLKKLLPPEVSKTQFVFTHGAYYQLEENLPWLLASYHPSRQNTQTGRLTPVMFDAIWEKAKTS